MTTDTHTTRRIGIFVAEWVVANDGVNLEGEPEARARELREAVRRAFPEASEANFRTGIKEVKGVLGVS